MKSLVDELWLYIAILFPFIQDLTKFSILLEWGTRQYMSAKINKLPISKLNLFELVAPKNIFIILNVNTY